MADGSRSTPRDGVKPTSPGPDATLMLTSGGPDVVIWWQAFDETLLEALHERRIPAYNYTGALPAEHFRHAPHLFHRMGYLKAECIRLVLETGRHVLVSDSDVR